MEEKGGEGIYLSICVWFNFHEERGGKRRGAKSLQKPLFAPPKLGGFGGEGRYSYFYYIH
jgi:hypothetical protein